MDYRDAGHRLRYGDGGAGLYGAGRQGSHQYADLLVSITERTREIGTRKALGATNGSIRLQFITESIVICLLGGFIGIVLGLILAAVATNALGYAAKPSVGGIVFSVTFSILIGVFFGYYPANKAAKMNPIEALRYE